MTTPRTRSLVSLAVALTATLTLGACASSPSHLAPGAPAISHAPSLVVQFDNESRDYVHVYLVGELRQWLLARVAPGARANLRIPDEAFSEHAGRVRLAVLAGERVTTRAAVDARAASAIAQPVAALLSQRWTFSPTLAHGQLLALPLPRPRG